MASEVKSLASQTAQATDQITAQISSIQHATKNSADGMAGIGKTITRVNEIATAIASAVEEQNAATQEISRSIAEASAGADEVSGSIERVNGASGEASSASQLVLDNAGSVSEKTHQLQEQVDQFIEHIKSA